MHTEGSCRGSGGYRALGPGGGVGGGGWRMQMCSGGEGRHDGRSTTS